MKENKNIKT